MKKVCFIIVFLLAAGCTTQDPRPFLKSQLDFNRQATLRMLDEMEKTGKADEALAWRAGPGRAPIGWQIMHFAATEDRMAKAFGGQATVSDAWTQEFKSGKPAGDRVPPVADVRKYLAESRSALESAIASFDLKRLDEKPAPDARFTFREMFQVLAWHEPHHHGQAQATFNLFKAARGIK